MLKRDVNYMRSLSSKDQLIAYKQRWTAVQAVEEAELRTLTIEQRWTQLNSLYGLAMALGLSVGSDDSEINVYLRWAKLRELN